MSEAATSATVDPDPALTAAVQTSHSAPAPTSATEQQLAVHESVLESLEDRLQLAEAFMDKFGPIMQAVEPMLAAEVPAASPLIGKVTALEQWAESVIAHFQGKLPPVPPAPPV